MYTYRYVNETLKFYSNVSAHLYEHCITALINCLFVLIVKVWLRDTAPLSFTHRALLCLVIFHFSDTLQTKHARLDNLYHLVCNLVSVSCELTP